MLEFLTDVGTYLEQLTEANVRLLGALKEYQELLVLGETEAIERATPYIDGLTGEIRTLDEHRRAYVDNFFKEKGWNGSRNFSSIARHVEHEGVTDEEACAFERAGKARSRLILALAEVDAQNSLNLTLVGQSMSFAEISLRALLGYNDQPSTYGPSADTDDGPSLLDEQV
jgi:hypothetical protein